MKANKFSIITGVKNLDNNQLLMEINPGFTNQFYIEASILTMMIIYIKNGLINQEELNNFIFVVPFIPLIQKKRTIRYIANKSVDLCNMIELIYAGCIFYLEKTMKPKTIEKFKTIQGFDFDLFTEDTIIATMGKDICARNLKIIKSLFLNMIITINMKKFQSVMEQEMHEQTKSDYIKLMLEAQKTANEIALDVKGKKINIVKRDKNVIFFLD